MAHIRRSKIWRWRFQWMVITIVAVLLAVYNVVFSSWSLPPASCPSMTTPYLRAENTCEPCADTVANTVVIMDEDPLSRVDLHLGRWDYSRSFKLFDYVAVGDNYIELSQTREVCMATQSSIERLHELVQVAAHWSGPISVAMFAAGEELKLVRAFVSWIARCQPDIYSRLAIHLAIPSAKPGLLDNPPLWKDCGNRPLPASFRKPTTASWRARNPYPQNHMRNMARKNCQTSYVFMVDVDIVPSRGMAESLDHFLTSVPKCNLCAYVVPTYELDVRVKNFPANKSELLRLSKKKLAIPFHRKVFIYNQFASNFTKWEASGGNESVATHVSHNVTNFELLYEPFYVAPDTVPPHDERFLGYGFTRNTQEAADLDYVSDDPNNVDSSDSDITENEIQELGLEQMCPELSGQIIGGVATSVRRHPYQVSMVLNGNSFCGGFIISRDYVMTAAHCVQNTAPNAVRLRVGSTRRDSGGRIVRVVNITVHPQYGRPRFDNDIAVLRLAAPLVFNNNVRAIGLPQTRQSVPLVRLTVTGWGLTAIGGRRIPRLMMEARVPVVPHWLCRLSYGDALTNNMFCGGHFLIGGVSSCQGDSGGPAVYRGIAYGVVSFARGCALPLSPTVFTNIAALRDWVTQNTGI